VDTDWREDPDGVIDLLHELEPGDRVRLAADCAVAGEEGFERGDDIAIDDTGTVVEEDDYGTEVRLDETVIFPPEEEYQDDWEAANVDVRGEKIASEWEHVGETDEEQDFVRGPAPRTVAILTEIERIEDWSLLFQMSGQRDRVWRAADRLFQTVHGGRTCPLAHGA